MIYTINYEEVQQPVFQLAAFKLGEVTDYYFTEDGAFHVAEYEDGSSLTSSENSMDLILKITTP